MSGPTAGEHIIGVFRPVTETQTGLHGTLAAYVLAASGAPDQLVHSISLDGIEGSGSIDVFAVMPNGAQVEFSGTEQSTVTQCRGTLAGTVTGPSVGDTGTWVAGAIH